jgi:hypothetical protein
MRHYVETVTERSDGSTWFTRTRYASHELALAVAKLIAEEGFPEQIVDGLEYQLELAPIFLNDFDEWVSIRANSFGERAQVREGAFVLQI